jgi:hypothetical protein
MPKTKRTTVKKTAQQSGGPIASRPVMPGYGVPETQKGMLPWSHITARMNEAQNYWVCTVSPDGQPYATPVWGLWLDDQLYFGGSPKTRRHRNLAANPAACIHLESGTDVVILQGVVNVFSAPERALVLRLIEISRAKYGYAPSPEEYEKGEGVYVFKPTLVLAWTKFPKDATRWQFTESEAQ